MAETYVFVLVDSKQRNGGNKTFAQTIGLFGWEIYGKPLFCYVLFPIKSMEIPMRSLWTSCEIHGNPMGVPVECLNKNNPMTNFRLMLASGGIF